MLVVLVQVCSCFLGVPDKEASLLLSPAFRAFTCLVQKPPLFQTLNEVKDQLLVMVEVSMSGLPAENLDDPCLRVIDGKLEPFSPEHGNLQCAFATLSFNQQLPECWSFTTETQSRSG
jgi:hypothetical protein